MYRQMMKRLNELERVREWQTTPSEWVMNSSAQELACLGERIERDLGVAEPGAQRSLSVVLTSGLSTCELCGGLSTLVWEMSTVPQPVADMYKRILKRRGCDGTVCVKCFMEVILRSHAEQREKTNSTAEKKETGESSESARMKGKKRVKFEVVTPTQSGGEPSAMLPRMESGAISPTTFMCGTMGI